MSPIAEYITDHAIQVDVARATGVEWGGSTITYPYADKDGKPFLRKRNLLSGKTLQPTGAPAQRCPQLRRAEPMSLENPAIVASENGVEIGHPAGADL